MESDDTVFILTISHIFQNKCLSFYFFLFIVFIRISQYHRQEAKRERGGGGGMSVTM